MFAANCTSCGRRELIFADQVTGLDNTGHGFAVRYTCWCGASQVWRTEHVVEHAATPDTHRVAVAA